MKFITASADETIAVGREVARLLQSSQFVLLEGDLGAGKTTLAKGIVSGLGAASEDDVSSPTFALMHEYGENPRVYHIDLYRLEENSELDSLGLDDIWDEPAVVLVEWGGRFKPSLPADPLEIRMRYLDENRREIEILGLTEPKQEGA